MNTSKNINGFSVNFIGIGAPKCGTTWLIKCLDEHPSIFIPDRKEVNFFYDDPLLGNFRKGLDWYREYYEKSTPLQKNGEFTTHYMYYDNSEKLIKATFPNTKLIVCLRNPADMIYSYYIWEQANFRNSEVADTFEETLLKRPDIVKKGYYYKYLNRFYDTFDKDQIHVILFDDILKNPSQVIKNVFNYIGVDDTFLPSQTHKKINESKITKNKYISSGIYTLINLLEKMRFKKLAYDVQSDHRISMIYSKINKKPYKYNPMNSATRKDLIRLFENDIKSLEKLIKRDLGAWIKNN